MTIRMLGQSCPRDEDAALVQGQGRYTGDIHVDGAAHLVVVRSPYAAARITGYDTADARAMSGVLAVLTAEDMEADGLGDLKPVIRHKRPGGRDMAETRMALLAVGDVRFAGDPVAVVVAETLAQAEDAAEAVFVDYEPGEAVTDVVEAVAEGAPALWPDAPDNIAFVFEQGDRAATDAAFARAHHVAKLDFRVTRVTAVAMEPRGAIAVPDLENGRTTLWLGTQQPQRTRAALAEDVLGIPADHLRVISPDVGGSLRHKNNASREAGLTVWAARRLKRPVRWMASRGESFLSDYQGRDNVSTVELALDREGLFTALRIRTLGGIGAYVGPSSAIPFTVHLGGLAGVYRTPHIHAEVTGVLINAQPIAPYRGAGRPEATYALERIIDIAALEMGIDRVKLRQRNLITPDQMPFQTGLVFNYDSGDFPRNMDMALEAADWKGLEARRNEARSRGRLLGAGIINAIEIAGGPYQKPMPEFGAFSFDDKGDATLSMGFSDSGMGHITTFRQIAGDMLGLDADRLAFVTADTDAVPQGFGTFGSRTVGHGGAVVANLAAQIIEKGSDLAAGHLEVAGDDVEFSGGAFRVKGTDRAITLHELAAKEPGKLDVSGMVAPDAATFPNGCHVCEAEVDPETGEVEITRYTVVDDVGTVVNPMLVKGQIHGGIAQGLGQALGEAIIYEPGSGQMLTGSFMDYRMPRAGDLPSINVLTNPQPSKCNPLGAKGAGEAGTVGALPVVMNAIIDAVSELGVRHIDMPATPDRVWRAIREARGAR